MGNMLLLQALAGVVASTALLGAGAAVARRTSVLARPGILRIKSEGTMFQGTNPPLEKENHLLGKGYI